MMTSIRTILSVAACASVLALNLPIITPTVSHAAEGEKVLNIYNWSDYIGEDTLAEFTKATGIKVNYDVYDSNETLEAKLLAGKSGYDLVVPSAEPFFARQVKAGIFRKLDTSKIPNLKNLDPELLKRLQNSDPGNEHGIVWEWGTNGFGYNEAKIKQRMPDAPVGSWKMVFDPAIVSKFADCGVTLFDSPSEIYPLALNYLGLDPLSEKKEDLAKAEALLLSIRPYIKYFSSSQYINDLANGDVCLSIGFSGDMVQAQTRATEAKNGNVIKYTIPTEGSMIWFDMMGMLKDAPHPEEAYQFMNFVLQPEIMAGISNYVAYANAVPASLKFVKDEIKNDPNIFPGDEVKKKLFSVKPVSPGYERLRTRSFSKVRAGK